MKKLKKLFRKLKSNAGSSIIMVIVSVAFIGIIVGALLSAAVLSYRLKLQDLNSKENFYYVEQAMNEIYAGVGTQTVKDLQDAYLYTVENMVEYDLGKSRYVTKSQDEAQEMFAERFYNNLKVNPFFKNKSDTAQLGKLLASYISNETVVLDPARLQVVDYKNDNGKVVGMIIRNVKVSRTQEYNRNSAGGTYTQSITTDIVIGDPDFKVLFDAIKDDDPNILKYSLVADMGVYVDQKATPLTIAGNVYAASDYYNKQYNVSTWDSEAAKTYKDKYKNDDEKYILLDEDGNSKYNSVGADGNSKPMGLSELYTHGAVTSKSALVDKPAPGNTYYNVEMKKQDDTTDITQKEYYDGENMKSKYSGFYVNGSQVSIVADSVIVPGMVAVVDKGSLSVYGRSGSKTTQTEVWTDGIVLDGYSTIIHAAKAGEKDTYKGAEAIFKADLYVKDDTEVNAAGATFQLAGNYYGYGDSTEKDARKFTSLVNTDNFQVDVTTKTEDGKTTTTKENRGHYNSSAIIVNGEQSTLNLRQTQNLFLAGRTYIELSKDVNKEAGKAVAYDENGNVKTTPAYNEDGTEKKDANGQTVLETAYEDALISTYQYHPTDFNPEATAEERKNNENKTTIRDYKTGESISIKSNQQAYIPVTYKGTPALAKDTSGKSLGYYEAELSPSVNKSTLFEKYFPDSVFHGKVPCILQEVSGKRYYYYDFERAYDAVKASVNGNSAWVKEYPSAQYFAAGFIQDYTAELNNKKSAIAQYLVNIGDYEDFDAGDIILPDVNNNDKVNIFSSGAITAKENTTFSIVRADENKKNENGQDVGNVMNALLTSDGLKNQDYVKDITKADNQYVTAAQLSDKLDMEYIYMKWNLGHYRTDVDATTLTNNDTEKKYIQDLVNSQDFGEENLTPINKFLDMSLITNSTNIMPEFADNSTGDADKDKVHVLNLASGYSVWVSNDDVVISSKTDDKGKVRGIVVTKGNVYFDDTVTDFEGMIVAGGKIYINSNVKTISSNAELCRTILRECMLSEGETNNGKNAKFLLSLFRGYSPDSTGSSSGTDNGDLKTIDMIDYTDVCSFANWMKNVE